MRAGGALGDTEPHGDLAVVEPFDDQLQYLPLARGEGLRRAGALTSRRAPGAVERLPQLPQGRSLFNQSAGAELRGRVLLLCASALGDHHHGKAECDAAPKLHGQRRLEYQQLGACRRRSGSCFLESSSCIRAPRSASSAARELT